MMKLKLWLLRKRPALFRLWLCGVAGITFVSLLPGSALPQTALISDKFEHGLSYLLLSWLAGLSIARTRMVLAAMLALAALGLAMEFAQLQIPGRSFEWADALANTVGVLGGGLLGWPLRVSSSRSGGDDGNSTGAKR